MRRRLAYAAIALLLCLTPACGDDGAGSPPDAAPPDAALSDAAPPPDSPIQAECAQYCSDLEQYCSTEAGVDRLASCSDDCAAWPASVRQCRVEHVSYAIESSVHCLHALGDEDEPTTPSECLL